MSTPITENQKWLASRRSTYPYGIEAQGHSLPGWTLGGSTWADIGEGWRGFVFTLEADRDKFRDALTNEGTPWREPPADTAKVKD